LTFRPESDLRLATNTTPLHEESYTTEKTEKTETLQTMRTVKSPKSELQSERDKVSIFKSKRASAQPPAEPIII
jgi:hypothetical protein